MYRLIIMKIDFAAEIVCSIQFCNNVRAALSTIFRSVSISIRKALIGKDMSSLHRRGSAHMRGICVFIVAILDFKATVAPSDDHIITNHLFFFSFYFYFSCRFVSFSFDLRQQWTHLMNCLFPHMEIDEQFLSSHVLSCMHNIITHLWTTMRRFKSIFSVNESGTFQRNTCKLNEMRTDINTAANEQYRDISIAFGMLAPVM